MALKTKNILSVVESVIDHLKTQTLAKYGGS